MRCMRAKLARRASRDLEDIYSFGVERWGQDQAERYADDFWKAVGFIEAFPLASRLRTKIDPPVRVHPFGSHLIVYAILGEGLVILWVRHCRSDWANDPL